MTRVAARLLLGGVVFAASATSSCPEVVAARSATLMGHRVRLDGEGRLVSWWSGDAPFAAVAGLAWRALETGFPLQDNGAEAWLSSSRFDPETHDRFNWPHNPAGLYAMLTDSALLWYAFSGDGAAVALARKALDHQLRRGTTPDGWAWPRVPYASADPGSLDYAGADDGWCDGCGRGDGLGVIEPDKVGELGFAYLRMFEHTGDARYRAAALDCAGALASTVRPGDERRSPWPFRVYAETGAAREEYSSNVLGAIELFDELDRLGAGDVASYRLARALAFDWMMRVPMQNDAWSGYFEDIEIQTDPADNPNQYSAMRTARWLLRHPGADPAWREHVAHLLGWVTRVFGADTATEDGEQWGAVVLGEQRADMVKMGSHTARYGATLALWADATGDESARERGLRSLAWATYACDPSGTVAVGSDPNEGWWFTDGYGDYIRQFLVAMAAEPSWAPSGERHLLASTSVVTRVDYATPRRVTWSTFDLDATDTLRVPARPARVSQGAFDLAERSDLEAEGFVVRMLPDGDAVVRVRHRRPGAVVLAVGARDATGPVGRR